MKKEFLKATAVNYMGGSCKVCGYNKCLWALHFHHLNPWEKEFNISEKSTWKDIQPELEKCILLCSNCHMETEAGLINPETLVMLGEL